MSLLEMVAAYSTFPNKGIRMQPHLIRKVYNRDGSLLEEYDGASSKVTSEYVALTMVEMMRGVTGRAARRPAHRRRVIRSPARPARSTTTRMFGSLVTRRPM